MVQGNVEGIRDTILSEIDAIAQIEIDEDCFAPVTLIFQMAKYSGMIRREISVYINRDGEIIDISIGNSDSVPLPEVRMRRSTHRLCGVRCIHTHPNGSPELSDVDLSALTNYRLDAIASIGVMGEKATGIQCAFLSDFAEGRFLPEVTGVIPVARIPHDLWVDKITQCDQKLSAISRIVDNSDQPERAVLVGIESDESLDELAALAESAGAVEVGRFLQKRPQADHTTYIGSGKAERLALDAQALNADLVIFDDELSGAQARNLENIIGLKVVDRTALILDIFAQRAQSGAGKLQVEMAQLAYRLPRLIGEGISLSRLGGGIGTRGPGETKLEISRRRIRKRLSDLKNQEEELLKQRNIQRMMREKKEIPVVALVGYTNAGKSTLLNHLSDANVVADNRLFVTLDPVSKRVELPSGQAFLLVDTVGFIQKLPHALVEAFRSTLEETILADLILIINDSSNADMMQQHDVVLQVLNELGAGDKPILDVMNKIDCCKNNVLLPGAVCISALSGEGISELLISIEKKLFSDQKEYTVLVPYNEGGILAKLHDEGTILEQLYENDGTHVRIRIKPAFMQKALHGAKNCKLLES